MNPDPQPLVPIKAFDPQTLRDAFTLLPGQIPAVRQLPLLPFEYRLMDHTDVQFDGSIFLDGPDEPARKKVRRIFHLSGNKSTDSWESDAEEET